MKKNNLKSQYRINEQIRVREVRIVGDDIESSIMNIRDALHLAEQKGVDLVEISPNADPPVCRLIDYSKFIYQQKKRQKEMKAKQVKIEVKEIRFGPQTDDHDYNFKLKHAQGFLSDGDKVKAYVFFRGRSILFKEQGEVLLLRFAQDLEEYGKVESMPVLEGKRMTMFIAPRKSAPKKVAASDDDDLDDDDLDDEETEVQEPVRKKPQQKAQKEYTGPKVEGEDFDD
ncbi:MAG: translation initiation factor IF-3 [Bacteroidaceae bacterium]|nr:translation initiation factor IF-3 [Bacteroidaceae bacterium]